jgi:hypothetical protein
LRKYWQVHRQLIILDQLSILQSNGDITKARTYIDKALELSADKPFTLTLKIVNSSKNKGTKGATETAKLSLAASEVAVKIT